MLPEVKLEVWLPASNSVNIPANLMDALFPNRHNKQQDVNLNTPRVWKMSLTEEAEINIFGDVSPYRTAPMPPLWCQEQYYIKKIAIIDNEQTIKYNTFIRSINEKYPESIADQLITVGAVEVFRAAHNVRLKNVAISESA